MTSETTLYEFIDEYKARITELEDALSGLVYEAEHQWPKVDPTRHHCSVCIQPSPQQGEPPAHLDWCKVAKAKALLAPPSQEQAEWRTSTGSTSSEPRPKYITGSNDRPVSDEGPKEGT